MERHRSNRTSCKNIPALAALFCSLCLLCLISLICIPSASALSGAVVASDDHFGQNFIYPSYPQKAYDSGNDYFFADKPTVTVDAANRTALIAFKTTVRAPGCKIHYGFDSAGTDVKEPVYVKTVTENRAWAGTSHVVTIDLGNLVWAIRPQNFSRDGLIIEYRLELYNPQAGSSAFLGDRFRIDGNFSRMPCIALGPFVDSVTNDSAVISWETDVPTRGYVAIDGREVSDNSAGTSHEVRIGGLQPATEYVYDVYVEGVRDERSYRFHTSPANNSFTFAFMADSQAGIGGGTASFNGVNYEEFPRLLAMAYDDGADFLLLGGDLTTGYTTNETDYRLQLDTYKQAVGTVGGNMPVYEVPGNHQALMDVYDDGSKFGLEFDKKDDGINKSSETVFAEEFVCPESSYPAPENSEAPGYKGTAYYFDYDNVRFIVYNSDYWFSTDPRAYGGNYEGFVMDREMAWIRMVLDDAAADPSIDHIFLVSHMPVFLSYEAPPSDLRLLERRDELWKAMSANDKVVACFVGHEHYYNRILIDNSTPVYANDSACADFVRPVWQIVSGGAGGHTDGRFMPLWANATKAFYSGNHYCLLAIEDGRVSMTVKSDTGEVIDNCILKDGPAARTVAQEQDGTARFLTLATISAGLIFVVLIYSLIRLQRR